jgi:hypothetical protein
MTPGLVDEIVMIDLLALFLSIATVEIVWYAAKKACPTEVGDLQFFLTFILVIVPFVMTIFFRVGSHKLQCDGYTVWLAAGVAVNQRIIVSDHRCRSFLYRANAMAMVGLA